MSVGTSLTGALPELLFALDELRAKAKAQGIEFTTADFGGLRTQADTALIMKYRDDDWNAAVKADPSLARRTTKEAWRPIAKWGNSMHNYGAAFDVRITAYPKGKSGLWALNWLADTAPEVDLVAGRDFVNAPADPPHFELRGGLSLAKKRWAEEHKGSTIFSGFTTAGTVSVLAILFFAVVLYFLVIRR